MFWSTQLLADFRIKVGLKIFNRLKVYFSMVYSSKLRVETVVHNRGCQLSKHHHSIWVFAIILSKVRAIFPTRPDWGCPPDGRCCTQARSFCPCAFSSPCPGFFRASTSYPEIRPGSRGTAATRWSLPSSSSSSVDRRCSCVAGCHLVGRRKECF